MDKTHRVFWFSLSFGGSVEAEDGLGQFRHFCRVQRPLELAATHVDAYWVFWTSQSV